MTGRDCLNDCLTGARTAIRFGLRRCAAGLAVLMCFAAMPTVRAAADTATPETSNAQVEEIIVTALKREMRLQDTPLSVSAVSSKDLEAAGTLSIEDALTFTPSINYTASVAGERSGPNITIRGVSNTRLLDGPDGTSAVGTTGYYLGEVAVQPIDSYVYDVDRVEILRGPQGTLYGAASMGGTIKVIPKAPSTTHFEGSVEGSGVGVGAGSQNSGFGGSLASRVNVPLIDGVLGVRASAYYRSEPGFINFRELPLTGYTYRGNFSTVPFEAAQAGNGVNLEKNANSLRAAGTTLSALYTPTAQLSIKGTVVWQKTDAADNANYDANLGVGLVTEKFTHEPQEANFLLRSIEASYNFGPVSLVSVSGSFEKDLQSTQDYTLFTFADLGGRIDPATGYPAEPIPATAPFPFTRHANSFSQELRLQSNSGGPVDWTLGGYYLDEKNHGYSLIQSQTWNANARPGLEIPNADGVFFTSDYFANYKNKAAFADLTYHITKQLSAEAGARYFKENINLGRTDFGILTAGGDHTVSSGGSVDESGVQPKATLSFAIDPDHLVYATASKGFRAGGINATENIDTPACQQAIKQLGVASFVGSYKSDSIWNYELGTKTSWLDRRLTVNASVYHVNWTDLQQSVPLALSGLACGVVLTANVGSAKVNGTELEVSAALTDELRLISSLSWTQARLGKPDPRTGPGTVEGERLQNVPDWLAGIGLQYDHRLSERYAGFVHLDGNYVGSRSAVLGDSPDPSTHMSAYRLLNIRAGVRTADNIEYTIFMDNVTNEVPELAVASRVLEAYSREVTTSAPRSVGFMVKRDF